MQKDIDFRRSKRRGLWATASVLVLASAGVASAQDVVESAPPMRISSQVDARDQRIVDLQIKLQQQGEQLAALAQQLNELKLQTSSGFADVRKNQPAADKLVIAGGKPSLQSADGKFTANLHGVMQLDTALHDQGDVPAAQTDARARDLNDGTNFRRARLGVDGKAFGVFNYNVLLDFGGAGSEDAAKIQELWIEYAGFKPLRLRAGAFAPNLGLADAASTNGMLFLERPAMAEISRTLAGGDRRIGLQLAGSGDYWLAAAAVTGNTVSSLNSTASAFGVQNYDEQLGFTARLAVSPLHGQDWRTHIGINGSLIADPADTAGGPLPPEAIQLRDRPELTVDGTRLIDTGSLAADKASHIGLELAAQRKNLLLEAEVFNVNVSRTTPGVSDADFTGWYVQGSWVITGEARKYNPANAAFDAPAIDKPFDYKKGQWGAFELAARYSVADLNDNEGAAGSLALPNTVRGGEQQVLTAGLNWYLNGLVKLMLDYQHVDVQRLNAAGLEIGQDYNAYALRTQFAF